MSVSSLTYDNMYRITGKSQHLSQTGVQFDGTLSAGYDLKYTYSGKEGKHFQRRTLVGVNDFALPQTDGDVTLKFNVMYTFSDGTGHIPSRVFEHKLQVGFTKP